MIKMSTSSTHDNWKSSSADQLNKPIEELIECIRLERKKYNEYTIIKDIALTCTTEQSDLSPDLQSKIHDAFMTVELNDGTTSSSSLLELPTFSVPELTYMEKLHIRNAVQYGIVNKSNKLFRELDELGISYNDNVRSQTSLDLSKEDEVLLNFKKELNEKQQLYMFKLEELISTLEQIIKLKSESFPNMANEKLYIYETKLTLYNLQSEVLNAKLNVSIFTETNSSLNAYQQLIKDIVQQQSECRQEIEELEQLKKKYEEVSCKQYSDILQKFLKYKTIVDKKKKLLYNNIHRNEM